MNSSYISPFAKPVYIMLKPIGSVCNLACEYCYYLEKSKFYPDVKNHIMTDQILEKFIKEYMECQTMQEVLFTWHGGETLMRPISFYKKALELQRKYAGGRQIDNCIQTNGTLLNDEWCQFFKENNFLVGVSIDGPQEFHDEYRRNRQGLPSFYKVMKGIELMKKHGVEYNAMALNTARRKFSLLTTCEQEKVNRMPPGLIFSKAMAFSLRYPCNALRNTFLCLAKAGGSRMMRS